MGDFDLLRGRRRGRRKEEGGKGGSSSSLMTPNKSARVGGSRLAIWAAVAVTALPSQFPTRRDPPAPSHHHQPTPNPRLPQAGAALFTSGGAAAALQRLSNGPQVDPGTNRSEIRMDSTAPHCGPNHRCDGRPGSASVLYRARPVPAAGPPLTVNRAGPR